jgi:hypothetical protein
MELSMPSPNGTANGIDAALSTLEASLVIDKPRRMPLLNFQTQQPIRDAEGNEGWVDVYSGDSQIRRRHEREVTRRRYNMRGRGKLTPEETEAEATDLLVALTADWYLLTPNGVPLDLPFTPENARRLYDAPVARWIREQVDEFSADRGNFMPGSSLTSSSGPKPSSERAAKP